MCTAPFSSTCPSTSKPSATSTPSVKVVFSSRADFIMAAVIFAPLIALSINLVMDNFAAFRAPSVATLSLSFFSFLLS